MSEVNKQDKLTQLDSKMPLVEPLFSTPEDVLAVTTFFQAPIVDTITV